MTFQERNDQGPEDAPAAERVRRLARELFAAGELPDTFEQLAFADVERFLELAHARIRAGEERRGVCRGWADVHAEPVVYRQGVEPVSHGMCDACGIAFAAEVRALEAGR